MYTWYCVLYDTTRWQSSDHHVSKLDTVCYMTRHVDSSLTITYVHLILCAIWHDTLTVHWPSRMYTWYCVLYDTTRWQFTDDHVSKLDTVCYMTRHVDSSLTITYVHLILCGIWHDTLTVHWPSRMYTWYCVLYDTTRWQFTDHHVCTLDTVWYMTRHVDSSLTIAYVHLILCAI